MPEQPPTLLLRGAAVFDSDSRTFEHLDLFCAEGRIALIAPGIDVLADQVVDSSGLFIVPGLIDCHVHLVSSGDAFELNTIRNDPKPIQAYKAARNALVTLQCGVTTVRDMGAAEQLNVHLAAAVESGLVSGPRIVATGMGVTMTGGHGHGFLAREADGEAEVRKAVREQLRAGATAIKLFASGGVMTPGVDPRSPSFTEAELRAGVEEAHKAFRVVGAHAQATDGIKNAIRAGVDSIEHGVWLDEEAIEMMLERGTYMVPTLSAPYHIAAGGLKAGIPPFAVDKAEQVLEDHIRSFQQAVKAGVKVAMGTDEGTPLNRAGENPQEALRMQQHGLSANAALMSATGWAADLLRLGDVTGRIRVGLAADLLVLRTDPLEDLSVITRPDDRFAVIKGGRLAAGTFRMEDTP